MSADQLQELAELVAGKTIFCTKEVLTTDEAALYMGIKKSYLYKLTHDAKIPHYKPGGKNLYFKRTELENWLLTNRVSSTEELSQQAMEYCMRRNNRNKINKNAK